MATVLDQSFLDLLAGKGASQIYRSTFGPDQGQAYYVNTAVSSTPNNLSSYAPTTAVLDLANATTTSTVDPGSSSSARAMLTNGTDVNQVYIKTLSTTITDLTTTTNTTSHAFKATQSVKISGKVSDIGIESTTSFEYQNTSTNTVTNTTSEARTSTDTANVTIPPNQTYLLQLVVLYETVAVPFSYDIVIPGSVTYSYKGKTFTPPPSVGQSVGGVDQSESSGEAIYYANRNGLPPYSDLNYNDLLVGGTNAPGQPYVPYTGQPEAVYNTDPRVVKNQYNTAQVEGYYRFNGTITVTQGIETTLKITKVVSTSDLTPLADVADPVSAADTVATGTVATAAATPPDPVYLAPVDPNQTVGDAIQLDATHHDIVGTGLGDEIFAGPGNDFIDEGNGDNIVYGGDGNDTIKVDGGGQNTLIGGTGDTNFSLKSTAHDNDIQGGTGANVINVDAPGTQITGGPGNNTITLTAASVGTTISAHNGDNTLTITGSTAPVQYVQDGYGLIILVNGDQDFAAGNDIANTIVWTDFFESAGNSVDGISAAALAEQTRDGAFNATPPVIIGSVAGQTTTDNAPIAPFSGVSVSDPDPGARLDLKIMTTDSASGTETDGNGTLTGPGLTETDPGVYTLSANDPAALTAALDAIKFVPVQGEVGPSESVTTTFAVTADEAGVETSDNTTTVTTTAANETTGPAAGHAVVVGTAGPDVITVQGDGNTVDAGGGDNTIFASGNDNIFVLPTAAQGFDSISGFDENSDDVLDLRQALASVGWDQTLPTLGDFLKVTDNNVNTTLSIISSGGSTATAIATLSGAGTLSLPDLLAHNALLT